MPACHYWTQVTVIIKYLFTLDEVLENPLYAEEIEKDVLEEAEKLGRVEKVNTRVASAMMRNQTARKNR